MGLPAEGLALAGPGLAGKGGDMEKVQVHLKAVFGIAVREGAQGLTLQHPYPQLLFKFALQGMGSVFARTDLASGKFPETCLHPACRPLAAEDGCPPPDDACGDIYMAQAGTVLHDTTP